MPSFLDVERIILSGTSHNSIEKLLFESESLGIQCACGNECVTGSLFFVALNVLLLFIDQQADVGI